MVARSRSLPGGEDLARHDTTLGLDDHESSRVCDVGSCIYLASV